MNKQPIGYNIVYAVMLVIAGILWGLGQWPQYFFLRFFALIPFIFIVLYRKHYILETFIFGSVAYIMNFYWLYTTFHESGKMPIIFAVLLPCLLSMYYGLQYPIIAVIYKKFFKLNPRIMYYSLPFIFVFVDSTYIKIFKHSIADSMIAFRPFVQLIDVTGMTGLILIIMFFNLGIFQIIERLCLKAELRIRDFIFILPLIAAVVYGGIRIHNIERHLGECPTITAALIQGNVTGKQKLDPAYFPESVRRYNDLTKQAAEDPSTDLIIWPESTFTRALRSNKEGLKELLYEDYPPLMLGIVKRNGGEVHNAALLIKNGEEVDYYYKECLLMFGEYVPLEKGFPILRQLTPFSGSTKPGNTKSVIQIDNNVRAAITICFEEIFPNIVRRKCNEGCNLLINMTNDSWFGTGLGPIHHSILGRLRAIENRRSFFRCTATGYTSASDPTGRIVADIPIDQAAFLTATLPLYETTTIYSIIGELLTYICDIFVLVMILYMIRRYFQLKHEDE